jgi:hypothetical protein
LRQSLNVYTVILVLCALTLTAQEKPPLKLITTTPMPGFTGDFDHFGLDLKGNRLFLAAEEHKTVEVFDLRTGARTHSIEGFAHPLIRWSVKPRPSGRGYKRLSCASKSCK